MTAVIVRKWDSFNRRFGFAIQCVGVLNGTWMGTTKDEVAASIAEIDARRESMGLSPIEWIGK